MIAINPERVETARRSALADDDFQWIVETFQALADATRARILYALLTQPMCVRDLALLVGVSESAISHQVRLLRERRLVKPRRDGNVIYYALDDQHVGALFQEARYHIDHLRRGLPDHPYPREGHKEQ